MDDLIAFMATALFIVSLCIALIAERTLDNIMVFIGGILTGLLWGARFLVLALLCTGLIGCERESQTGPSPLPGKVITDRRVHLPPRMCNAGDTFVLLDGSWLICG